jgi:hypothetical protein
MADNNSVEPTQPDQSQSGTQAPRDQAQPLVSNTPPQTPDQTEQMPLNGRTPVPNPAQPQMVSNPSTPQPPPVHPAVQKAGIVHSIAQALAGGPSQSTTINPDGSRTVTKKQLKQLAEQSPQLFGHEAVKETLKRYALKGAKKAMTGAAWAGGAEVLHTIWNDVFGKK